MTSADTSANRVMCVPRHSTACLLTVLSQAKCCPFEALSAEVLVLDVPRNLGLDGSFYTELETQAVKCSEKGSPAARSV